MYVSLWAAGMAILAGAIGYWLNVFCIQPILKFRDRRNTILKDFIYFAQVINAEGLNDEMNNLCHQRKLANQKASAELTAAISDLPFWYEWYLKLKGQDPAEAAKYLRAYATTTNHDQAHKIESFIRRHLGLPKET